MKCVLLLVQMFICLLLSLLLLSLLLLLLLFLNSHKFFCSLLLLYLPIYRLWRVSRCISMYHDRPLIKNKLCVDLSYLIFRTCLALNKAMMVCMARDPLVYTAAMAVVVINHKVIHKRYHVTHRMLLPKNQSITQSKVDGINGYNTYLSFHIIYSVQ